MKNTFLLFLLTFPLLLSAQDHHDRLAQLDVLHYDFTVDIPEEGKEISVVTLTDIKFLQNSQSFVLNLVAEQEGKGMVVEGVNEVVDQRLKPLKYAHEGDELTISMKDMAQAGQERRFQILYHGVPKDGLVISKNRHGHRTFFGDNWPNRARNWLATVDHPSDKATVNWTVTVPSGFECVANGKLADLSTLDNGRSRYHYTCSALLPTKVMVIGVADFVVEELDPVKGIPLSSWVFPEDSSQGFDHYDDAAPILRTFMDSIAPYAYEKLANVQSKTRYGGMENASSIFYYEASVDDEIIPLLAHEIAHQWFGNMATEADWHHIWLSEGFATYFTNLYIEWSQGEDALRGRMAREREKVLRYNKKAKKPIVDPSVEDYNRLLNPNSYEKGAWVLHMLRQEIGYPVFMRGVREYYARYGGKNALTADLQAVMEEVSGRDLRWFFEQWIFQGGHPELEVSWKAVKGGKMVKVVVEQVQEGPAFSFGLDVGFEGNERVERIEVEGRKTTVVLDADGGVDGLVLDPAVRLLADMKLKD